MLLQKLFKDESRLLCAHALRSSRLLCAHSTVGTHSWLDLTKIRFD